MSSSTPRATRSSGNPQTDQSDSFTAVWPLHEMSQEDRAALAKTLADPGIEEWPPGLGSLLDSHLGPLLTP